MAVDYYNILKVSRTATEDDLRKVYKRLAMKWHPDKNTSPGAEAKFKQISEAYEVLSDPQSRQIYDLYGEEALKSGQFTPPFQSEKAASNPFNPRDAEDIFNDFFGGSDFGGNGFRNSNRNHNQYHHHHQTTTTTTTTTVRKKAAAVENKLVCSLEELYKGSKRKMKISRIVPDDSGKAKTVEEILAIEIKPGWKKGTKITFPEKGNQEPGFAAGDLIFVVDEKAHGVFKRDGNDLVFIRRITLLEALTGTTLSIVTLDGRSIPVPIKDVVKPGHELMIPNEGMPISKEPGKRGNLRIKFDIKFPSKLSADQKSDLKKVLGGGGGG